MSIELHIASKGLGLLYRLNFFRWLGRMVFGQQITTIAGLTVKSAVRFKLFPVLFAILMLIVFGLPVVLKDDGTARGLTQILLTYTLGMVTVVLGLSTLWLACGTLARDVEECQMQVVAVKPIARWQIWLGKWVGLMTLNAMLLGMSGVAVYILVNWRASKLPAAQQEIIKNEVLIGRASFKPPPPDMEPVVQDTLKQVLQRSENPAADRGPLEVLVRQQLKSQFEAIPPLMRRRWEFELGSMAKELQHQPLFLRIKFITSETRASVANPKSYPTVWEVGPPETPKVKRMPAVLPSEAFHEFPIPLDSFDEKGVLTVDCSNASEDISLVFSLDDGIELLYRESSFGLNFARGLAIIYMWLALLAALGLAAASFLSFPVAAFVSLSVLMVALSSGLLTSVLKDGSLTGPAALPEKPLTDIILLPMFRVMVGIVNLAQEFSPIDSLSAGRSVTWTTLARAGAQIIVLMGGIIGTFGIFVFTRRELATAQGQQ